MCHVGNVDNLLAGINNDTDLHVTRICGRDKPIFEGVQARISCLPFERRIFTKIVQNFHVHPTITRTIGREIAYFSIQHHGSYGMKDSKISEFLKPWI